MSRKLFFEDGSTLEVAVTYQNGGRMAAAAYQRVIEFIDGELMDEFDISLQADGLTILKGELEEVHLDEVDFDEDDLDDFDDELIIEEEEEWGFEDDEDDDDEFIFR